MAIGRRHFGGAKAAQTHGAARLHQTPVSGCRHRKELPLKKDHPWAGIPPRSYWLPACCCPVADLLLAGCDRQQQAAPASPSSTAAQQNSAVTGLVRQQLTALLADRPDHPSPHHRDRHRPTGGAPPNGGGRRSLYQRRLPDAVRLSVPVKRQQLPHDLSGPRHRRHLPTRRR